MAIRYRISYNGEVYNSTEIPTSDYLYILYNNFQRSTLSYPVTLSCKDHTMVSDIKVWSSDYNNPKVLHCNGLYMVDNVVIDGITDTNTYWNKYNANISMTAVVSDGSGYISGSGTSTKPYYYYFTDTKASCSTSEVESNYDTYCAIKKVTSYSIKSYNAGSLTVNPSASGSTADQLAWNFGNGNYVVARVTQLQNGVSVPSNMCFTCTYDSSTGVYTAQLVAADAKYSDATKGSFIEVVSSSSSSAYPDDGVQDGYWYTKIS